VNAIYLLPLGSADRTIIANLGPELERAFHASVAIHEKGVLIDPFYDAQRAQYNSTSIIAHLLERGELAAAPSSAKILGVTGKDLFISILTYVFGEAQLGGQVGVVSYYRLPNERYGLPGDQNLFSQRLVKEAMHELGHMYGLIHCRSLDCVMHISTYVEDIDIKPAEFCRECEQKLLRAESRR
jgi:archaemetzincin